MPRALIFFCFLLINCNSNETGIEKATKVPEHNEGMLSLFIDIGYEDEFSLVINDSLKYSTYIKGASKEGPQQLLDVIPKNSSPMKFELRIAERDTTFTYDLRDVDSLRFGLYANNNLMISNETQHVWFYD